MRGLLRRRSSLTDADKDRLGEAEAAVAEFQAALDDAITLASNLRADGQHDETLYRLSNSACQLGDQESTALGCRQEGIRG